MSEEFVTLATFTTPAEAEMAKNRLEASGITAFLMDEESVAMLGYLSNAMGGVKLLVERDQQEQAEAILAGEEEEEADTRISAVPLPTEPEFPFPMEEAEQEEPTAA